jgi:hypothetical protein
MEEAAGIGRVKWEVVYPEGKTFIYTLIEFTPGK